MYPCCCNSEKSHILNILPAPLSHTHTHDLAHYFDLAHEHAPTSPAPQRKNSETTAVPHYAIKQRHVVAFMSASSRPPCSVTLDRPCILEPGACQDADGEAVRVMSDVCGLTVNPCDLLVSNQVLKTAYMCHSICNARCLRMHAQDLDMSYGRVIQDEESTGKMVEIP